MQSPMHSEITISVAQNFIESGAVKYQYTHRWESSVLAALSLRRAETPASAVSNVALTKLLSDLGQSVPLNRKQLARLFDSIATGLAAVGLDPATHGIQSLPRKRTVGSWWWNSTNSGDTIFRLADAERLKSALQTLHLNNSTVVQRHALSGANLVAESVRELSFATDRKLATTRTIIWKCFFADAHAWDGSFTDMVESLERDHVWKTATPAARILLHLRLARANKTLRNFKESTKHFHQARRLATASALLDAMFSQHIQLHLERLRYNQNPIAAAQDVEIALTQQIEIFTGVADDATKRVAVNPITLGHAYNLRALTRRRAIEALPADAEAARRDPLVSACIADGLSALFCLLTTLELETTQNIASNIAYNLQRIALRGWLPPIDTAQDANEVFEWYRLSFAWHYRFHLADNTAWEYIFLGEYWLSNPDAMDAQHRARSTQRDGVLGVDWQGRPPGEPAFYEHALKRAEQIDDARQITYAALNLYGFGKLRQRPALVRRGRDALTRIARIWPEVITLVRGEGYELPRLNV